MGCESQTFLPAFVDFFVGKSRISGGRGVYVVSVVERCVAGKTGRSERINESGTQCPKHQTEGPNLLALRFESCYRP
jgi:hypothetical protein